MNNFQKRILAIHYRLNNEQQLNDYLIDVNNELEIDGEQPMKLTELRLKLKSLISKLKIAAKVNK